MKAGEAEPDDADENEQREEAVEDAREGRRRYFAPRSAGSQDEVAP